LNDERLRNYDQTELLTILADNRYHSPEHSESDGENTEARRLVNVYNPSWRSEEV
jgi:hypothetical protein